MRVPLDRHAVRSLPDAASVERHDAAVFDLRARRDGAMAELPELEALRHHAASIKAHTLDHLERYLRLFERRALQAGAQVHWAAEARDHNRIVHELLARRGVSRVVKSKSMLTEDCGLNPYLEARGIDVVDSDLGERIVQLADERPSHLVVPAVHRRREEIGDLFHERMGIPAGESDPARLTEYARRDLRPRFLAAQAGLTGVNFAIAETGSLVLCTNEGNADLGMSLPPLHIACMGIEKIIPTLDDLAVFLRLLARSATGQPITAYTSLLTGPRPGAELHIVVVDDGRSRLLADSRHRGALACIRCGACLNTCPVYRHAGGHAWGRAVSGPIGSVLAPALGTDREARQLPLASTLCGSCTAVCPVRIDLHDQLLHWRSEVAPPSGLERLGLHLLAEVLRRPRLYRGLKTLACAAWPLLRRRWPGNPLGAWLRGRELPEWPRPSPQEPTSGPPRAPEPSP
ncbi:MAG: lactate utilization protein B [Myxococcota bacterium]